MDSRDQHKLPTKTTNYRRAIDELSRRDFIPELSVTPGLIILLWHHPDECWRADTALPPPQGIDLVGAAALQWIVEIEMKGGNPWKWAKEVAP